ncbi:unnamed protein product [Durusdinium trenchii]|uniref:Uncharacterized protein n=1 Tax=Durusdinium trenchii TaxID=1381693 RepID=A0ABP0JQ43_9DINO
MYATAHGIEVSAVTEAILNETEEGIDGWACKGLDCKARGPMGNAMYRQIKKCPGANETYKWLFDDLKKKFRQSWAVSRSFDFVARKRIRSISTTTKNTEIGQWRSELQLQVYFGGTDQEEAKRQASNYIKNCRKFPDAFVKFNTWTEADNFLLVEKLVSKTEEEAWREVAEMTDGSGTYETESFKCKAVRKFAAHHGLQVEEVNIDDVVKSPLGLRGWGDYNIVVPGVSDHTLSEAATEPADAGKDADTTGDGSVPRPKAKAKAKAKGKGGKVPGSERPKKPKKELSTEQMSEQQSKEILTKLQRSQQIMEKISHMGDELPSQFSWARGFLEEYKDLLNRFKDALTPSEGAEQDLTEFVDELKLNVITKAGLRSLKKEYGKNYESMLALFVDRMNGVATKVHNMTQAMSTDPQPKKRVATLAYHITRAGGQGLEDLALNATSAVKNGHRHVKKHAGKIYPEVGLGFVKCPMYKKRDSQRVVEEVPIYLPSTAFQKYITQDMVDNTAEFDKIVGDLDAYWDHPLVKAAKAEGIKRHVRPIALYWDGVVYTKKDSFFAFYVTDILSSEEMCQCGCRGWCSLYPLLLRWTTDLKGLEVVQVTSLTMRAKIHQNLVYKFKMRGRCLSHALPLYGLKKSSRLMPTPTLPDVAGFEFKEIPFETSWWVGPEDGRLLHDCPLLNLSGVGLETFSLDIMHSWHLGPLQLLVSKALNYCLDTGLWGPRAGGGGDAQDRRKLSLLAIKSELFAFYRDQRQDKDWLGKGSEVWNLTLTMLGSTDAPSLHAKAAESHGLALFVRQLLERRMGDFEQCLPRADARQGKFLLEASKAASELDVVFGVESRRLTRNQVHRALGCYSRFLSFYNKAGGPLVPKTHFMVHLIQRSLYKGNPRKYSTYRDESLNGQIAKIARSCHRRTWANIIHWKTQALHDKCHARLIASEKFQKLLHQGGNDFGEWVQEN